MGAIITSLCSVIVAVLSTRPSDVIYWIKWIISYISIRISKHGMKRRFDLYDMSAKHDPVKVNFIIPPEEIALESPIDEFKLHTSADEISFFGVNSKSECLLTKIARGVNHSAEAWIYLKLDNGKVYQLRETTGYQQSGNEEKAFTCGGLQMHYMQAMRSWRIFFNGLLRETDKESSTSGKEIHVKFVFIWRATSDAFDFTYDVNNALLARGLADAKWKVFYPPWSIVNKVLNMYAQSGSIFGTVNIDGTDDDHFIYLFGEKFRNLGENSFEKIIEINHLLGYVHKNGSVMHLMQLSIENVVKKLTLGLVVEPTGHILSITDSYEILGNASEDFVANKKFQAKFNTDIRGYTLTSNIIGEQNKIILNDNVTLTHLNFDLNDRRGSGIIIKGARLEPMHNKVPEKFETMGATAVPLVVSFSEEICQESHITGGKGSSLGKLTELSKDIKSFVVPNGIVVTTKAYELFITKGVENEIKCLEDILYENKVGDIKTACQRVIDEVIKSNIPDQVLQAIVKTLQMEFPEKDNKTFAIRSSATGEDTEQMSAAGQMDTFLGVSGIREILSTVKRCWASQFSFVAVQYKRQNGQVLNSPMAVVIQEMVSCDVAGVLFTCDPLTGNPTVMSITANYGLGESVVSASEEPDTLEIRRAENNDLSISKKIIGAKHRRITLQDEGGTHLEEVSEEDRQTCCITDEMALRLANAARKIQKSCRSQRDIEWGFWENNLYIFQSRPVTSGSAETDFEIEHEFDSAMRVENEYFTVGNVGEVMPGATPPLSLDVCFKNFRIAFQKEDNTQWHSSLKPKYFLRGCLNMYNHAMFYLCDLFEKMKEDKDGCAASCLNMFGRILDDEELFELVDERYNAPQKYFQKLMQRITGPLAFMSFIKRIFTCGSLIEEALKNNKNYRIPVEKYKTAQELFDGFLYSCTDLSSEMTVHLMNSEASGMWNMFVLSTLKNAAGEFNTDVYRAFSQLLKTSSGVESGDIPGEMESLAYHIAKEMTPEEFKQANAKDLVELLTKSETSAGQKYREFLKKHGHRCLREFDMRTKPWGMDPTNLIQLLKNLVGRINTEYKKSEENDFNDATSNLKLDLKTRLLLKFLIPRSRKAVENRERTKSLIVRGLHAWRKVLHHIAKLMVSEGRIPYEDLLFFMTLDEIKELLKTRSPRILSRANHRRRLYPAMDKYIFPEIMKGFPKPINMDINTPVLNDEYFSMKGVPVSQGVAKAFVRVAVTLEEAASLKPGEILLTFSTDIGWSPYFPILSGVVTEIGGLISHGAVVSREYGLPCIAGLHGVTRQFQTGDYVLLDGNKGILQKLPKPEDSEIDS